ncbi:FAD-dependent oxidoreductase [Thalassotalea euphylliae]|uniref:FAD-dependent oxidoreductase n=1 Tax=Thalassotalea euphylliae TaxID=1655234 RepID=A0A3E0U015_9GAMM|nr:FAD-dependent oxidoreductase [Thalassotalea euphylliae]REL30020.1 FAD-dependent oxidoreductase [Thalassotalea euphylliae]
MQQYDVLIVGGGMIGAATALSLAELGLKVVVFEQHQPQEFSHEQAFDLRVSAISVASENLLKDLGAWQQILQWRACPYRRLGVWESELAYAEFNADAINQPHLGHIVENRLIQLSLWQQVEQHQGIKLVLGQPITNINQQVDSVLVETTQENFIARLVVAADGANSFVRKQARIGCTGWNYQQSAMLINVKTELSQQDITWQRFTPSGPLAMLPMPGHNASLVWYEDRDRIKQLAQLNNEELTAQISQYFPEKLGKVEVVDKGYFPLTRQHANKYVQGNIVLLGDAAHTINPLAGQGVNLGFKDVLALRNAIADAIANGTSWHASSVLNRYEKMRRRDNLLMMSAMDGLYATFSNDSPVLKAVRNIGLFAAQRVTPVIKNKVLAYACGL